MPQQLLQQDLPMDAEISTEGLRRNRIFVQLQSSFLKIFINYKGELVTLQWWNPADTLYCDQVMKVKATITSNKTLPPLSGPPVLHWEGHSLTVFLLKMRNLTPVMKKHQTNKPILKNNCPVTFKSFKDMNAKED